MRVPLSVAAELAAPREVVLQVVSTDRVETMVQGVRAVGTMGVGRLLDRCGVCRSRWTAVGPQPTTAILVR